MNLKPEKRLDKNGRLVTRHVRDNAGNNGASALPSPRITGIGSQHSPMTTDAQLRLFELLDEESQWLQGSDSQIRAVKESRGNIASLTPEVVETASSVLARHPQSRRVRTAVSDILKKVKFYDDINEMNLHLPFAATEVHCESDSHQMPYSHFQNRRTATQYILERDGKDVWDDQPTPEQLEQAVAIAHFIVAGVKRHYDDKGEHTSVSVLMSEHKDVMNIFIENPDRAEELGSLVLERGVDADLVSEFITQHHSLNEGVL